MLATVQALVTDEERAQVPELDAAIARAVALHRRLVARPDVQALFAEGRPRSRSRCPSGRTAASCAGRSTA